MDSDRCPGVEFFTGSAGSSTLSVDQIVGGIVTMRGQSPVGGPEAAQEPDGLNVVEVARPREAERAGHHQGR